MCGLSTRCEMHTCVLQATHTHAHTCTLEFHGHKCTQVYEAVRSQRWWGSGLLFLGGNPEEKKEEGERL